MACSHHEFACSNVKPGAVLRSQPRQRSSESANRQHSRTVTALVCSGHLPALSHGVAKARTHQRLQCCRLLHGVRAIHGGYKGVRRSPSSGLREAYPSSLEQLHRLDCASSSRVLQGNVRRYTVHLVVVIHGSPESSARPSVPFGAAHSCKKHHNKGRHLLPLGLWILICAHHKSATDAPNMAARMPQRPDI